MIYYIEKSIAKSWVVCSSPINGGKEIIFSTFVNGIGETDSLLKVYINTHTPTDKPILIFSTNNLTEAFAKYNAVGNLNEAHALHAIGGAIS